MNQKQYDLEYLSQQIIERIEDVYTELSPYDYSLYNDRLTSSCPVHKGDNPEGFSILARGIGNWQCFTNRCHEKYGNDRGASILSLIQAIRDCSFYDAVKWAANYLGIQPNTAIQQRDKSKSDFINLCKQLAPNDSQSYKINRELAKKGISIPSKYFISRGFSEKILLQYDVGDCLDTKDNRYERAVVPLHDENGSYVLGYSTRSIFEKCKLCNYYHSSNSLCPVTIEDQLKYCKWRLNGKFNSTSYIYNLLYAKRHIDTTGTIILVESPGNVWKLEESGIHNSLALMGVKFTVQQKAILQSLNATNLIIALDNDDPGRKAAASISKECSRYFNTRTIFPTKNDWADMDTDEIRNKLYV